MLIFIRSQRVRGVSDDDIRAQLKLNNWSDEDITKGFANVDGAQAPSAAPQKEPSPKKGISLAVIIPIIFVLLAGGVGAFYASSQNIWPFGSVGAYTEENILSGLLMKGEEIRTSRYAFSLDVAVVDRKQGAIPFTYEVPNKEEIEELRGRDNDRMREVSRILYALYLESRRNDSYPASTSSIVSEIASSRYSNLDGRDPVSGLPYAYTSDGDTFSLTVTFETDDAVYLAERGQYGDSVIETNGKTVVFTDKSATNLIPISASLPKPQLVQLGEMVGYLPPEFSLSGGVSAATDFSAENSNWEFALAGEGDLGDLTYKVAAQAKKVGELYYFRLDNFPNLFFLGDLNIFKGQWIEIDPESDDRTYSAIGSIAGAVPELEDNYLEERDAVIQLLRDAVRIADEERLISFKRPPYSDQVQGESYTRYDLTLDKEALLRFLRRAQTELEQEAVRIFGSKIIDRALIAYLESDEYGEMHTYLEDYFDASLWVNKQGFPVQYQTVLRIIPQDSVTQLRDKEVELRTTLTLSDINANFTIVAPEDAKTIEEIEGKVDEVSGGAISEARSRGADASVKSNLTVIALEAELFFDSNRSLYSNTVIEADVCRPVAGSLFASARVIGALDEIEDEAGVEPYCASSGKNYAISSRLPSGPGKYYCVDSTGYRGEIPAHIIEPSCQ